MYIYLIKYNGNVIAAAQNDEYATAAIKQYMRNNKTMDINMFDKEAIRYFGEVYEREGINSDT